jgi:hypothetical protein
VLKRSEPNVALCEEVISEFAPCSLFSGLGANVDFIVNGAIGLESFYTLLTRTLPRLWPKKSAVWHSASSSLLSARYQSSVFEQLQRQRITLARFSVWKNGQEVALTARAFHLEQICRCDIDVVGCKMKQIKKKKNAEGHLIHISRR